MQIKTGKNISFTQYRLRLPFLLLICARILFPMGIWSPVSAESVSFGQMWQYAPGGGSFRIGALTFSDFTITGECSQSMDWAIDDGSEVVLDGDIVNGEPVLHIISLWRLVEEENIRNFNTSRITYKVTADEGTWINGTTLTLGTHMLSTGTGVFIDSTLLNSGDEELSFARVKAETFFGNDQLQTVTTFSPQAIITVKDMPYLDSVHKPVSLTGYSQAFAVVPEPDCTALFLGALSLGIGLVFRSQYVSSRRTMSIAARGHPENGI